MTEESTPDVLPAGVGRGRVDPVLLLRAAQAAQQAGEGAHEWLAQLQAAAEWTLTDESLDALLLNALRAIRQALTSDAVAVLLANEAGDALVSRVSVGLVEHVSTGVHINAGAGIAGRVLATGSSLVVDDILDVEVASPLLLQSGVRSIVAVPMTVSGKVIGVVHTSSHRTSQFTESDAALLQVVADRLAGAVERVRLFEAERSARAAAELLADRLARVQRLTAALSSRLDANQVADIVLTEVSSDTDVMSKAIWLIDQDRRHLRLLCAVGSEAVVQRFSEQDIDSPLPGATTARTGEPIYVSSAEERDARFPELTEVGASSVFAVLPLRADDAVLGVLAVGYSKPQEFDPGERLFLVAVAEQAAQALERARLRQAEVHATEQLAFLAEAASALAASLDEGETLAGVARLMVPRVADMATVHLFDDNHSLRRVALAHRDPDVESKMRAYTDDRQYEERSAALAVGALHGQPRLVRDAGRVMQQQIALDRRHANILEGLRVRSAIAVPLSARGEVFGMLTLLRIGDGEPYHEGDLALAAELGRRAATAIDNSRLHRRRAELARTLQRSLLPPRLPSIPGLELAASYHPAGEGVEVGGDFYDVFTIDADRWAVAVGDVCGSGAAAAALTAQVRYTARAVARTGLVPAEVVQAVNSALLETIEDERFCTMVYGEVRLDGGRVALELVSAGHPIPVVVRASGVVEDLACRGQLLGVMPTVTCAPVVVHLEAGDAVVFVTDGVLEARSAEPNPEGHRALFGVGRLNDVLVANAGQSAADMVRAVDDAVVTFSNGRLADDAAVLALRAMPVG